MEADYEVIIVGGGLAGAACALALAQGGVAVGLIDAARPEPVRSMDEWTLRVVALSPASERLLSNLGVWRDVVSVRAQAYRRMEVWDAAGSGRIDFDCLELNEPQLGHIVETRLVQSFLWDALRAHPRATLLCPARLEGFAVDADQARVKLADGRVVRAPLLVGADGGRSLVRRVAGIDSVRRDYHQRGLVTHVASEKPHRDCCYQRFLAGGPLAFLPLAGGRCSIVWSLPPERADELERMPGGRFALRLAEAIDHQLGSLSDVGPRASFPLHYLHARRYVDDRIALIGDAAHVVHPLAGQGANLGFMDAAALAQVVMESRGQGRDYGRIGELRPYERWRKGDNLIMANALHGLRFMFDRDRKSLAFARNLGLDLVNELKPVKKVFMRQAAGMAGRLPKLVRSGDPA